MEEEVEEEEEEEDEQHFARFEEDDIVEAGWAATGRKGKGKASNEVEDEADDAWENDLTGSAGLPRWLPIARPS